MSDFDQAQNTEISPTSDEIVIPAGLDSAPVDDYADASLPWHEDARFQKFLNDRKELESLRQRAEEVNNYEPYKPIFEKLRSEGINSHAEFETRLAQQHEQTARRQQDQYLGTIATDLMSRVNSGDIDQATANRLYAMESENVGLKYAQSATSDRLFTLELNSLKSTYDNLDSEWVKAVHKANPGKPLEQIAKMSHDKETAREQAVLAKYNSTKFADNAETANRPTNGGGAPVTQGLPDFGKMSKAEFDKFWESRYGRK